MNYRNYLMVTMLKEYINPKNLLKAFYKPYRIPYAIKDFYSLTKTLYTNVIYKPTSPESIIQVYRHSLAGLSLLAVNCDKKKLKVETIEDVFGDGVFTSVFSVKIGDLFERYGSDKSTKHDYHLVYSGLLEAKSKQPITILEIGLGTNNIDVLSNMGSEGKPGASLRAFRDACRFASVYGADIDKRILFSEERIKTFFIDQTKPNTFIDLKTELNTLKFDLIIDDGLHNSEANINTLNFALDMLNDDGVFIIEDISANDYDIYQIIAMLIRDNYSLHFLKTKIDYLCMIRKKS